MGYTQKMQSLCVMMNRRLILFHEVMEDHLSADDLECQIQAQIQQEDSSVRDDCQSV